MMDDSLKLADRACAASLCVAAPCVSMVLTYISAKLCAGFVMHPNRSRAQIVTPQPPRSLKQSVYQVRMVPKRRLKPTHAHYARSVDLSGSRLCAICP